MKTRNFLTAVVIFFLAVSASYSQSSYSFNDGLNAAKSSGKKIFLYIYSATDNWSQKMNSEVFSQDPVKNALSDFVLIKIDASSPDKYKYQEKDFTSEELAKKFGGTGYPTYVIMNSDGSVISFKYNKDESTNLSGFIGAEDFIEMLNFFKLNKYKDTDILTVFQN